MADGEKRSPGSLTIVGTGIRTSLQTTSEARSAIEKADKVLYLLDPVGARWVQILNPTAESLDNFYSIDGRGDHGLGSKGPRRVRGLLRASGRVRGPVTRRHPTGPKGRIRGQDDAGGVGRRLPDRRSRIRSGAVGLALVRSH